MQKNNSKYYLICFCLISFVGLALIYPTSHGTTDKSPININALAESFYPTHPASLDDIHKTQSPRILLPELRKLTETGRIRFFQQRFEQYKQKGIQAYPPCNSSQLSALTTCWLTTNNPESFEQALSTLLNLPIDKPKPSSRYGNGWQVALNYDLLNISGEITHQQHQQIQEKLQSLLTEYLALLDNSTASLWHGRLSLASNAWLCASMLDANDNNQQQLVNRAHDYFLQTVQSVAITEAWPEGFSYWINNRAFVFTLASSAYINTLVNSPHHNNLKQLVERIGLWHLYATRPDHRIEGFGDEGSRVDLKDETRRVIDLIASLTANERLAQYSLYLQNRHGAASYYRHYRWGFPLFNDPKISPRYATGNLALFNTGQPTAELFGKNATNALYLRSSWQPDATFISYRAGHHFTHHGHYDAGHFTIFKSNPLAVNSSNYGDYTGENRLNYAVRTLAKNSLLIQKPNEQVKPNHLFKENVADGGQRITLATGSALRSVEHWQDNLYQGLQLSGAKLNDFTHSSDYTYIESDLTSAYNSTRYDETNEGGKVSQVQRSLLYLNREDVLLVYDQITTTDPAYRVKWLLHSLNKPAVASQQIIAGNHANGIIRSNTQQSVITAQNSHLKVTILQPENATQHLIGGKDYRYYVETDGDDSTLDGRNMSEGSSDKPWFDAANWRTEIFKIQPTQNHRFLVALAPSVGKLHPVEAKPLYSSNKQIFGALLASTAVLFTHSQVSFTINLPANIERLLIVGPPQLPKRITINHKALTSISHRSAITETQLPNTTTEKSVQIEL